MSSLQISQTHGSRNDILVVAGTPDDHFTSGELTRAVTRLCDRRTGLGSDGVYFLADRGDGSADAWFFNPDGSAALLCGNGMRCAGRLLLDRYASETVTVRTGPYRFAVRRADSTSHGVRQVAVELPPVDFTPDEPIVTDTTGPCVERLLPAFHPERPVSALAVPNAHLVTVVDAYSESELVRTGRRVAATPRAFPIGANVSFVLPLGEAEVFVHTYERGAGLTPSCGSGVTASRAVVSQLGMFPPEAPLLVRNPGGPARAWLEERAGRWQPVLEGNATVVAHTELDPATLWGDDPLNPERESQLAETTAFAALFEDNREALSSAGVHPTLD